MKTLEELKEVFVTGYIPQEEDYNALFEGIQKIKEEISNGDNQNTEVISGTFKPKIVDQLFGSGKYSFEYSAKFTKNGILCFYQIDIFNLGKTINQESKEDIAKDYKKYEGYTQGSIYGFPYKSSTEKDHPVNIGRFDDSKTPYYSIRAVLSGSSDPRVDFYVKNDLIKNDVPIGYDSFRGKGDSRITISGFYFAGEQNNDAIITFDPPPNNPQAE